MVSYVQRKLRNIETWWYWNNPRRLWHRFSDRQMSRCRVCWSKKEVIQFDPRGLWAFFWRKTYCPEHCPDHHYIYDRWEGHYCDNCGQQPDYEWHTSRFDS